MLLPTTTIQPATRHRSELPAVVASASRVAGAVALAVFAGEVLQAAAVVVQLGPAI